MTAAEEERLYREAYNAHEMAERFALAAMYEYLSSRTSDTALMVLADRQWGWEQRGFLSREICDYADMILTDRLEEKVESCPN